MMSQAGRSALVGRRRIGRLERPRGEREVPDPLDLERPDGARASSSKPMRYSAWVWSDGSSRYGRTVARRGRRVRPS